jgi:hypothetical protein
MPDTVPPSEAPGFRLNDTVTAGNWPKWLIVCGPDSCVTRASVSSGMSCPPVDLK